MKIATLKDIYLYIDSFAPYSTQCEWDSSGIAVGDDADVIEGVLISLDCTPGALSEAKKRNCNLVLTHHPLIFKPLHSVGRLEPLYEAIASGTDVISAHTNLDRCQGGVNDALCSKLLLKNVRVPDDTDGDFTRIGETAENCGDFARFVSERLKTAVLTTDIKKTVKKVMVSSGAGGEFWKIAAEKQCDAFVTGEAKHHEMLEASRAGLVMITATHYATEAPVLTCIENKLKKGFPFLKTFVYDKNEYTSEDYSNGA